MDCLWDRGGVINLTTVVLWGSASRLFSKQHVSFFYSSLLVFFFHVFQLSTSYATIQFYGHGYSLEEIEFFFMRKFRCLNDRKSVNKNTCLFSPFVDVIFSRRDISAEVFELMYYLQKLTALSGHGFILIETQQLCFICVHEEINASWWLFLILQQRFS